MLKSRDTLESFNKLLSSCAVKHQWHNEDALSPDFRFETEYDQSKIIYSNAFRRLSGKSHTVVANARDHFRSRMVHTVEVSETAAQLGKVLGLNTNLISAIALGHDLGHAPFGYAGEQALKRLVKREAENYVGLENIAEQELDFCFHHASNSARLLTLWVDQDESGLKISKETIEGVLTHNWSPWKGSSQSESPGNVFGTPRTYEGQVVAIADQVAALNHDTEDILDSVEYSNYNLDRFDREIRHWLHRLRASKRLSDADMKELIDYFAPTIEDGSKRGYGRKSRIENVITGIKDSAAELVQNPTQLPRDAMEEPIPSPGLFGIFLDFYEHFVRNILSTQSFFIDSKELAIARIGTIFNHLWPAAQTQAFASGFEQLSLPGLQQRIRTALRIDTKYLEHFLSFVQASYIETARPYSLKLEYEVTKRELGIDTWVSFLYEKCEKQFQGQAEFEAAKDRLLRLIALIHFISGLTDRYSIEIFNELTKNR